MSLRPPALAGERPDLDLGPIEGVDLNVEISYF